MHPTSALFVARRRVSKTCTFDDLLPSLFRSLRPSSDLGFSCSLCFPSFGRLRVRALRFASNRVALSPHLSFFICCLLSSSTSLSCPARLHILVRRRLSPASLLVRYYAFASYTCKCIPFFTSSQHAQVLIRIPHVHVPTHSSIRDTIIPVDSRNVLLAFPSHLRRPYLARSPFRVTIPSVAVTATLSRLPRFRIRIPCTRYACARAGSFICPYMFVDYRSHPNSCERV